MSLRIRLTECNEVDHNSQKMVKVLFEIHLHYVGEIVKKIFFFALRSVMDIAIFYRSCQFIQNMELYFILEL